MKITNQEMVNELLNITEAEKKYFKTLNPQNKTLEQLITEYTTNPDEHLKMSETAFAVG